MLRYICGTVVVLALNGCGPPSPEAVRKKLVGSWEMQKITQMNRSFRAEQHLRPNGTFEMRGAVPLSTGGITFVVHGTWRADAGHLYQTATNSIPNLGLPLHREERHTLLRVRSSEFSIRTVDGEERRYRRKK